MPNSKFFLFLLTSLCTSTLAGCDGPLLSQFGLDPLPVSPPVPSPIASPVATTSPAIDSTPLNSADPYQDAIDRASSAFTLGQSAQSQDDWRLVARRWQQAVDLMASVPNSSPNFAQAQKKVPEYRNNLTYAQQQASRPTADPNANGTVVIRPQPQPAQPSPQTPRSTVTPASPRSTPSAPVSTAATQPTVSNPGRVFYAPIIRRDGNTPVINVRFNNNQTFAMIVDTGASGTLITQEMARTLGVVPVAAAMVDTASERGVTVPLGYVSSIEVNGAVASQVLVAIAGPQLATGLLGHDFFGNYDVTIRADEVEFRERL